MYGAELSQAAPLPAPALKSKRCLLLIKRPEKGLALPLPEQLPALLAKDNSVVLPFPPEPAGKRAAGKAAGEVRRNQQPVAAFHGDLQGGAGLGGRGRRPRAGSRGPPARGAPLPSAERWLLQGCAWGLGLVASSPTRSQSAQAPTLLPTAPGRD